MTPDEYMAATAKSAKQFDEPQTIFPHDMDLLHASLGLVTEAAETADVFKRYLYYGKKIDVTNLKEEAGDLLWYLALMLRTIGSSFDEVTDMNIEKLKARYPEGFEEEMANNRNSGKERAALQKSNNGLTVHPETGEVKNSEDWAKFIGIAPRTFRERKQLYGNIPEIYLRHLPNSVKEMAKNAS